MKPKNEVEGGSPGAQSQKLQENVVGIEGYQPDSLSEPAVGVLIHRPTPSIQPCHGDDPLDV
jgi:hypothetical protein